MDKKKITTELLEEFLLSLGELLEDLEDFSVGGEDGEIDQGLVDIFDGSDVGKHIRELWSLADKGKVNDLIEQIKKAP